MRFYRATHKESADVSDSELLDAAASGGLPREHSLSPPEFIRRALASGLLPPDFDPQAYRISRTHLWGTNREDWELIIEYLNERKLDDEVSFRRPFNASFYKDLYFSDVTISHDCLRSHWECNPRNYGSVLEALFCNGWTSDGWVSAFTSQSYVDYNSLADVLRNHTQALVHFIEQGWRDILPISIDKVFDVAYYEDLSGGTISSPAVAYRIWVEQGLARGAPANERAHLHALGVELSAYPGEFDWRGYMAERPHAFRVGLDGASPPSRWDALQHLVEHGIVGDGPFPITDANAAAKLLLASGDRFAMSGQEQEAARCYERGLLAPDPPNRFIHRAADQALRQGHPARALRLYREMRRTASPAFWTLYNGAKAAFDVGETEEAAEWILAGLQEYPRNAQFQELLLEVQRARFDKAICRHLGRLRRGVCDTGIGIALNGILELFLKSYQVNFGRGARDPKTGRPSRPLRLVVLANKDLPQCTFYRVELKAEQLGLTKGVHYQIFDISESDLFRSAAATADLALFYRIASNVEFLRSVAACRSLGIPTIYEIDDLVFDPCAFPDPLASYKGSITEEEHFGLRAGVALFRHAVESCDIGLASTHRLASHLRDLVRYQTALVHRNGLSLSLAEIARSQQRPSSSKSRIVTLFYGSGTKAHMEDFGELLEPVLTRLMAEQPQVHLLVCGYVDVSGLEFRFPGRVRHVPFIADRIAYLAQLLSVDINLAVLSPSPFSHCKSEIKWLEAAAFGVPSVVSDVEGYRETLRDGIEVVRVQPTPASWFEALRNLVLEPARRVEIGTAARDRALELYEPSVLGRELAGNLVRVVKCQPHRQRKRSSPCEGAVAVPQRPRVLLVNVFFPPQSIGGATRVVRDQAAELLSRYANRYEVGILCGNNEQTIPYRVEAYNWRGANVWSITSPFQEHMDWVSMDPAIAGTVDAVLDFFKPHLVHAHCIQRLTATTLERATSREIPYIVTAHDAWWVSDHQFFVDGANRLRMPWESEEFETDGNPHSRTDSLKRRLYLRSILDRAAAVLTVSESFAAIYREVGVDGITVLPNGLPELPPLEPQSGSAGRVRLAHLGGAMAHKGYFLLRRALERGKFDKLTALVMDHGLQPGEEREETWGATPVRIIARVPQDRVGSLYGSFDVLCAPSTWPESYGLVAREALHYGKWVIASTRGAMGDDIVDDQNGWRIDVSDPGALPRVLEKLQDDPGRYIHAPPLRKATRTSFQQVRDLVRIYDRVLAARRGEKVL